MKTKKTKTRSRTIKNGKINSLMIANRGEIVLRIAKTCKKMGIKTVAVHAEDDHNRLIKASCDKYVSLKRKGVSAYLDIKKIIKTAKANKVDAIHPGYGFLSENSDFAHACENAGLIFIGPPSGVLKKVADKIKSKKEARKTGMDTPPFVGPIKKTEELTGFIDDVGYPIILKSTLGGGGRGMRIISDKKHINEYVGSAEAEVAHCFGYSSMFAEKYIKGYHVEFQFLTDIKGNSICLQERECSIQRRFQKLIEETPSMHLDNCKRKEISEKVCKFVSAIGYVGAGTVEFLITARGKYYFLELNPRIQVEHGITELVTGIDLVREQIRLAEGRLLGKKIKNAKRKGHAIQCRIVAENARKGFVPGHGTIMKLILPHSYPHTRVDSAIYKGMKTKHNYDSLLAKIMVEGHTREAAIRRMLKALRATNIQGVDNTITFHEFLLKHPKFQKGYTHTAFLKDHNITKRYSQDKLTDEIVGKIAATIFDFQKYEEIKEIDSAEKEMEKEMAEESPVDWNIKKWAD